MMTKLNQVYECKQCGNMVEMVPGAGTLVAVVSHGIAREHR